MTAREYFERLAGLERAGVAYAVAMVVDRWSPVSSHLGDRAIVFPDGRIEGFVGGSCSRDIVRRQALDAMRAGRPRLVKIDPEAQPGACGGETETFSIAMGCASEGAVSVYVEPHLPPRLLVVAGHSPVADRLVRLSATLEGFRVVRLVSDDELGDLPACDVRTVGLSALRALLAELDANARRRSVWVAASQGHYDEAVLECVLTGESPAFVGLLASRKRGADVLAMLGQQGIAPERLAQVHHPVGLAIGAREPGEVAVSILAGIVATIAAATDGVAVEEGAVGVDPVCAMEVALAAAPHRAEYAGRSYVFCCAHCRAAFLAEPHRYAGAGIS